MPSENNQTPTGEGTGAPEYTSHKCYIYLENNTSNTFDCVILGYHGGAGSTSMVWNNVAPGQTGYPLQITYRTGDLSTDQWFVTYSWNGWVYTTDYHQCNLESSDDGGAGYIRFNGMTDVVMVPPESSNCDFNAYCVND